jgi:hypothetical protein
MCRVFVARLIPLPRERVIICTVLLMSQGSDRVPRRQFTVDQGRPVSSPTCTARRPNIIILSLSYVGGYI